MKGWRFRADRATASCAKMQVLDYILWVGTRISIGLTARKSESLVIDESPGAEFSIQFIDKQRCMDFRGFKRGFALHSVSDQGQLLMTVKVKQHVV